MTICPSELQLNKANTSDTKAAFWDLHLSISSDIVIPKCTINMAVLIFKSLVLPLLDGDVSHSTSYGVYISQLI